VLAFGDEMRERAETERVLDVLRPYAANWSGSLGRGDLVVPQREIPRLINDLLDAVAASTGAEAEATDTELFHLLVDALRHAFRILKR